MQPNFTTTSRQIISISGMIENIVNDYLLKDLNLSFTALRILDCVNNHPRICLGDICQILNLKHSNVSQRLAGLEAKKLVRRHRNPKAQDKRNSFFSATPLGQKTFQELTGNVDKANSEIEKDLKQEDLIKLNTLLNSFGKVLADYKETLKQK